MLRSALESHFNRVWYGQYAPGPLYRLLEKLYCAGFVRRTRRDRALQPPDLAQRAIVVVGNLTAGGTGKTPVVIRLCQLLQRLGYRPGVVTRGYGRRSSRPVVLGIHPGDVDAGDEPQLIFERTGCMVAVGPDRVESARALFANGADIVLSDDGLQHHRLPRSYEICVVDGQRGFGNGHCLPAGPLRESTDRLDTVDAVLVNRCGDAPVELPTAVEFVLRSGDPQRVGGGESMPMADWLVSAGAGGVIAVAGIGNPERFFLLLESLGIVFDRLVFPDHHRYSADDFAEIRNSTIVMTEKDAVKCRHLGLDHAWFLPVSADIPEAWEQGFVGTVRDMIETMQRQ